MSLTIDATPGGSAANSYLTVEAAGALLAYRFGTDAWDNASLDDKHRALMLATVHIDAISLRGIKNSSAQALEFPRNEQDAPVTQIPKDVQQACAVEALWLLQHKADGGRSERQKLREEGVKSFRVGSFTEQLGQGHSESTGLCGEAVQFLRYWLLRTGSIVGPREELAGRQDDYGWQLS